MVRSQKNEIKKDSTFPPPRAVESVALKRAVFWKVSIKFYYGINNGV